MALPAKSQAATIRTLLDKSANEIQKAVPKHIDADRLLRVAMTSIQKTPKLLNCTPKSLLAAVMESAQLGLPTDGILGHAYLIPYGNVAQFQMGYRGFIELAWRSGKVESLYAYPVYANDEFKFRLGLNRDLVHVPTEGPRGDVKASYAVVRLKDGGYDFEVLLKSDIDKARAASKAGRDGPWVTHYPAMAQKTAILRLAKRLPLSTDFQRAAVLDEYGDQGFIDMNLKDGSYETIKEKTQAKVAALKEKLDSEPPGAGNNKKTHIGLGPGPGLESTGRTLGNQEEDPGDDDRKKVPCGICGTKCYPGMGMTRHTNTNHPDGKPSLGLTPETIQLDGDGVAITAGKPLSFPNVSEEVQASDIWQELRELIETNETARKIWDKDLAGKTVETIKYAGSLLTYILGEIDRRKRGTVNGGYYDDGGSE